MGPVLFMVRSAAGYHESAVDLLEQHDAEKRVRHGHVRKGQHLAGFGFDAGAKAVRAADSERDAARLRAFFDQRRERLRRHLIAVGRQGDQVSAGR